MVTTKQRFTLKALVTILTLVNGLYEAAAFQESDRC
jgi:hypothetical protein